LAGFDATPVNPADTGADGIPDVSLEVWRMKERDVVDGVEPGHWWRAV
jgi:hypothetical protein